MNLLDFCALVLPCTDLVLVVHIIDFDSLDEQYKVLNLNRYNIIDSLNPIFYASIVEFVTSSGFNIQVHIKLEKEIYNKFLDDF